MISFPKSYIYIVILILAIISFAVIFLLYEYTIYNKQTSSQDSLSFKVGGSATASERQAAAVLLMAPTTGQFYVGDTISVALLVNTTNQSINAVDGQIVFPSDKLEILNISRENSILNLWAEEPTLSSRQDGSITFSGGLPSPGFIGTAGKIMTISFKAKKDGNAMITLSNALVLANDGFGTDILADIIPTQLTLLKPKIKREVADINEDGKIDLFDLSVLLTNWGTPSNERADLSGDGTVGTKDFSILLSKWTR